MATVLKLKRGRSIAVAVAAIALAVLAGAQLAPATRPTIEPAQRAAFSVLRMRTPAPSRALQSMITHVVSTSRPLGLYLSLGRRVVTPGGVIAWVVPGDGNICVVHDGTATAGCTSTQEAIRHGMSLGEKETSFAGPSYLLLGLVRDGVRAVEVFPDNRPPLLVPVIHNVYAYLGSAPARAVPLRR